MEVDLLLACKSLHQAELFSVESDDGSGFGWKFLLSNAATSSQHMQSLESFNLHPLSSFNDVPKLSISRKETKRLGTSSLSNMGVRDSSGVVRFNS